jgi:hypothetical protein
MDANLKQLDDTVNKMVLEGKALEAMEKYYADDVVMQENTDEPCVGLAPNLAREKAFFGMIEQFNGMKILSQAIGDGVSTSEWIIDVKLKGMPYRPMHQVAVRRWKNGKIASERFYYNKG